MDSAATEGISVRLYQALANNQITDAEYKEILLNLEIKRSNQPVIRSYPNVVVLDMANGTTYNCIYGFIFYTNTKTGQRIKNERI